MIIGLVLIYVSILNPPADEQKLTAIRRGSEGEDVQQRYILHEPYLPLQLSSRGASAPAKRSL